MSAQEPTASVHHLNRAHSRVPQELVDVWLHNGTLCDGDFARDLLAEVLPVYDDLKAAERDDELQKARDDHDRLKDRLDWISGYAEQHHTRHAVDEECIDSCSGCFLDRVLAAAPGGRS